MLVMVIITYPPDKAPEVQEMYQKVPELPDSVERVALYGSMDGLVKAYGIYEIDNAKIQEGSVGLLTRLAGYNVIEGFRWKTELIWRSEPDAQE